METLLQEFNFYKENQDKLVAEYSEKYIVIVGSEVVGAYSSEDEAIRESLKSYELGKFLVQYVGSGSENFTQTFHSRVIVNGR